MSFHVFKLALRSRYSVNRIGMILGIMFMASMPWTGSVIGATTPAQAQSQPAKPAAKATDASKNTDGVKVGQKFGDWVFECAAIAEGETLCSLVQVLAVKQSNRAIARFNVSKNKAENAIEFTAQLPIGLDIPAGVSIALDTEAPIPLTILTCGRRGCLAQAKLASKSIDQVKDDKKISLTFKMRGAANPTTISGSQKGLKQGIAALK